MSEITIKNPKMTVEVFNKEGVSMGTFSGQQATNIVVSLQRGFDGFITATNDAGDTVSINPDCVCSMKQTLETEEITFDDMSTPFGCCGSDRISAVTVQYVDENKTNISPLVTLSGRVGTKYTTEQKAITGYTFASVDGAKEGEFQPSPVSVVYHYTKNAE